VAGPARLGRNAEQGDRQTLHPAPKYLLDWFLLSSKIFLFLLTIAIGCQGTVPAALPLFAAVGITRLLGWHRKPRWRPDNATLTIGRYVDELSDPGPADTQSDETPGAVWASLAGSLAL
jgi:hypothetical protein